MVFKKPDLGDRKGKFKLKMLIVADLGHFGVIHVI